MKKQQRQRRRKKSRTKQNRDKDRLEKVLHRDRLRGYQHQQQKGKDAADQGLLRMRSRVAWKSSKIVIGYRSFMDQQMPQDMCR